MRTIKQFISKTNKVYFYFKTTDLCKHFYQKAVTEGMELSRYVQSKKSPKSEKPRYLHLFTGVRGVAPNGGKQMRRAARSGYGRCVRFRPLPVCDRR